MQSEESFSESASDAFARSVKSGLSAHPKTISSKYFYNREGDRLFAQIMDLPEYYLSRAETEILKSHKRDILAEFLPETNKITLVELGAGNGAKTRILLEQLQMAGSNFKYVPVDISANVLQILKTSLQSQFPHLSIAEMCKDYIDALQFLRTDFTPKLVLFLGSNIGNFSKPEAENFLQLLRSKLNYHDRVLIGFDLKKNPRTIYKAYNDSQGVTKEFNLNLLRRINEELGGNFDPGKFMHYPAYDPGTGEMRSYLLSTCRQKVMLRAMKAEFTFDAWEPIFTEVSMKYSMDEITLMANKCGLVIEKTFTDRNNFYVDVLMRKKDSMRDAHHPKNS